MAKPLRFGQARAGALACALTLAICGAACAAERKTETPEQVYDREVECASIAAASAEVEGLTASLSPEDRAHAQKLVSATRSLALASGRSIGLSADQIGDRIAAGKRGIVQRIDGASSQAARQTEIQSLGKVLIACALVSAIEGEKGRP